MVFIFLEINRDLYAMRQSKLYFCPGFEQMISNLFGLVYPDWLVIKDKLEFWLKKKKMNSQRIKRNLL